MSTEAWVWTLVVLYWAYCIYWGVRGAIVSRTASAYMIGGRQIPPTDHDDDAPGEPHEHGKEAGHGTSAFRCERITAGSGHGLEATVPIPQLRYTRFPESSELPNTISIEIHRGSGTLRAQGIRFSARRLGGAAVIRKDW